MHSYLFLTILNYSGLQNSENYSRMKFLTFNIILSLALLTFNSCETEVELGAPYEKIPIVYGLLDVNDTLHFIKITKAFGGSGNSVEVAQIPDSSYFNTVDGQVEVVVDNEVVNTYNLMDTIIPNKEPGAFYYPEQKVYYFKEESLPPEATYRLVLNIDEGDLEVEAETDLINGVSISSPSSFSSINLATPNSSSDNVYSSTIVTWIDNVNAVLYGLTMDFVYEEEYVDGSSQIIKLNWNLGQFDESDGNSAGISANVLGEDFYPWLGDNMENNDQVVKRIFRYVQFHLSAADETLQTYIDISEPVTGIVQSKPEFTNIEGGRGIFASRNRIRSTKYFLGKNSQLELCRGQYTGQYLFCSDSTAFVNEDWYCN